MAQFTPPPNPMGFGYGYRQKPVAQSPIQMPGAPTGATPGQAPVPGQPVQQQQQPADINPAMPTQFDELVQAIAAKRAQAGAAQAGKARGQRYGTWGSIVNGAMQAGLEQSYNKDADAALTEQARLQDDRQVLEEAQKRKQAYEVIKMMNPKMSEVDALHAAKAVSSGILSLDDLVAGKDGPKMTDVNSLQTQINGTIGNDFRQRTQAIRDITKYAEGRTGFSDHALIFRYMKFLDPNSTVREGEFATVEDTGSVPERIRVQYNKAVNGEKLTDEQRQEIVSATVGAYPAYVEEFKTSLQPFINRAEQYGVSWDQISVPKPFDLSKPATEQKTKTEKVDKVVSPDTSEIDAQIAAIQAEIDAMSGK